MVEPRHGSCSPSRDHSGLSQNTGTIPNDHAEIPRRTFYNSATSRQGPWKPCTESQLEDGFFVCVLSQFLNIGSTSYNFFIEVITIVDKKCIELAEKHLRARQHLSRGAEALCPKSTGWVWEWSQRGRERAQPFLFFLACRPASAVLLTLTAPRSLQVQPAFCRSDLYSPLSAG